MKKGIANLVLFLSRNDRYILYSMIFIILLCGVFYSIKLGDEFQYPDEELYYKYASNIVSLHAYTLDEEYPSALLPPGYALLLAIPIAFGAKLVYLRMINFIILALCVYILHEILRYRFSSTAAIIGLLLILVYPVLFYTAGTLFPQTYATLLLLVAVVSITKSKTSYWSYVFTGIMFALLTLTAPAFFAMLFITATWIWFSRSKDRIKPVAITIGIALLIISVWCARNYITFNKFVFISANSGIMLL